MEAVGPIVSRISQQPNKWTFKQPKIMEFVRKYWWPRRNLTWLDPFYGKYSPIHPDFGNDLNPKAKCRWHLHAAEWLKSYPSNSIDGVVFDPPYSLTQVKKAYNNIGIDKLSLDDSKVFYAISEREIYRILKPGGWVLKFGWNSNAIHSFQKMKIVEVLLVNHGAPHHDTICTAQWKRKFSVSQVI